MAPAAADYYVRAGRPSKKFRYRWIKCNAGRAAIGENPRLSRRTVPAPAATVGFSVPYRDHHRTERYWTGRAQERVGKYTVPRGYYLRNQWPARNVEMERDGRIKDI